MILTQDGLIKLYTNLVRARAFDQAFIKRLAGGKLLGFYHQAEGGEAPGVAAATFLNHDDYLYPHIRGHGLPHVIAKGVDPKFYMAEHAGKATGSCGGMSTFHLAAPEFGLFGVAGTIGSGFPVTVGYGLAAKKNGRGQVAVCCFGDGTSNRGTFHECALMTNNWKLPVIFLCENNGVGMYVPARDSHPLPDISSLAAGYGMPAVVVDGQDVIAVAEAMLSAIDRARQGRGPTFIEAKCHRFGPHAIGLPDFWGDQVRDEAAIAALREKSDPVRLCREKLMAQGMLNEADVERIDTEAAREVEAAEKFADESPVTDPSTMPQRLYA